MARPYLRGTWTEQDDYYLISQASGSTHAAMAEYLGRDIVAVRNRIRLLRGKGIKVANIRAGKQKNGMFAEATSTIRLVTEPQLSTSDERNVLRDEIAKYLASLITSKRLSVDTASKAVERIKTSILQAPDSVFRDAASRRVADVVADFL